MAIQIKGGSISANRKSQVVREFTEAAVNSALERTGENMSPAKSELAQSQQTITKLGTDFSYSGLKDISQIHDIASSVVESQDAQYRRSLAEGNTGAEALYDAYSAVQSGFNQKVGSIQKQEKFNKILTLSGIDDQYDYEQKLLEPLDYGGGVAKFIKEHDLAGLENASYDIEEGGVLGNINVGLGAVAGFMLGGPLGAGIGAGVGRGLDELVDLAANKGTTHIAAMMVDPDKFLSSQEAKDIVAGGIPEDTLRKAIYAANKQKAKEIHDHYHTGGFKGFWGSREVDEGDFDDSKKYFG